MTKTRFWFKTASCIFQITKIFWRPQKFEKKKILLVLTLLNKHNKKVEDFFSNCFSKKSWKKKIPLVLILLNKHNKKVWDFFSQLVWPKKFEKQIPFVLILLNRHIKKVGDFFLKLCGLRTFKSQKCLFSNQKGFKVYGKIKIELS